MATEGKKTEKLSCWITKFQDETIKDLQSTGVFGEDRTDVVRALLQIAIDRLRETGYVKETKDWRKSLRD